MWWIPWILSSALLGGGVLMSYAFVLFDAFGDFPVSKPNESYLESPYWLGLHKNSVTSLVVFQILAAIGYVVWQVALVVTRPTHGLFADTRWLIFANMLFLLPSILWPFAAHRLLMDETSLLGALLSSACLWAAAAGILLLVGGTFEDHRESPVAMIGILLTSTVVVVADGAGWSALAIHNALHPGPTL
jgi:hypothetical protein